MNSVRFRYYHLVNLRISGTFPSIIDVYSLQTKVIDLQWQV